jgi:hypothetical protein
LVDFEATAVALLYPLNHVDLAKSHDIFCNSNP